MATDTRLPIATGSSSAPSSWGLGDGQAIPWEYAPAPEARDIVTLKERYGLFIGGREVPSSDGSTFVTVDPATEEPLAHVARATPVDIDKAVRAARRAQRRVVGAAVRSGAGQVPVPDRAHPAGAQPRVRGPRIDGLGQADQGEPRRRRAARGGPLLVLRGLGGQARLRVPGARRPAAWRRRPDHPVELPAADARVEDRAGARGRQHRGPEAGLDDAALGPALRRGLPAGGPAAGRRQHRAGARRGRACRSSPIRASTRSRSPVRPRSARKIAARRRRHGQGAHPGARRQGRQHRVRRRPARPGHRGHRQRHLLQPGRGLLRRFAPARPGVDRRDRSSTSSRTACRRSASATRSTRTPTSGPSTRRDQLEKITELVASGVAEGAELYQPACDLPERGYFFRPTLFTNVAQSHRIAREEIFGPVLSVLTFRTPDEAVEKANNTAVRPVRRGLDGQGQPDPRDGVGAEGRRRLGQHVQPLRPDVAVRRLQGVRASVARAACTACTPTSGSRTADGGLAARPGAERPTPYPRDRHDARLPPRASRSARRTSCTSAARSRGPRAAARTWSRPRTGRRSPTPAGPRARTCATRSGPPARPSRAGPARPR